VHWRHDPDDGIRRLVLGEAAGQAGQPDEEVGLEALLGDVLGRPVGAIIVA
jgi:hypothetical protein